MKINMDEWLMIKYENNSGKLIKEDTIIRISYYNEQKMIVFVLNNKDIIAINRNDMLSGEPTALCTNYNEIYNMFFGEDTCDDGVVGG